MTELVNELELDTEVKIDELSILKQRATQLGITFSPNIGVEKLREKVNAALKGDLEGTSEEEDTMAPKVEESRPQMRSRFRKEALKLRRIRLTCLNPVKKEWPGEIFTFSNSMVGTIQKFVPFTGAEEGYHVPEVIFKMVKNRKCQVFTTVKDARGNATRVGKLIPEFAIEVLDPLTKEELEDLATRQALNGSIQ